MKKAIFLFSGIILWSSCVFATVINVNNHTPSPGQFASLQLAINSAVAGDTIYLAGTGISYAGVSIDKQLTIMGPGFTLNGSGISNVAQMGVVSLTTPSASGTKFMSIRLLQLNSNDAAVGIYTNIVVERCIVDDCLFLGNDDWTGGRVEGCLFTSAGPNITSTQVTANFTSGIIRNNICNGTYYYATANLIEQNIFLGTNNGNIAIISGGTGNTFHNNVVVGRNCNTIDITSNCTGNLSYACLNPDLPGTGNIVNTNPMFVNYNIGIYTWLYDFHLAPGSPCIDAGVGGRDIGVYDGDGIYRKDGEPDIPVVMSINVPAGNIVPSNSNITINVTTNAHE